MGWFRGRSELDEREELLAHIRIEADRLIEEGVPEAEAMRRAREQFDSEPTLTASFVGRRSILGSLGRDLRLAFRRLVRAPVSTAVILLSLIVGIGVNTSIFSIADQALVRPLPIPDPDEVVQLEWQGRWIGEGRGGGNLMPHPLYAALKEEQSVFEHLSARSPGQATLITPAGPERAPVALVTGSFFRTMQLTPHLGRLLDPSDDVVLDGHPVAVLSHAFWRTRFGEDPEVVGRTLTINGQSFTVVGVAPETFHGTDWSVVPVLWVPMMMNGLIHEWGRLDQPRVRFQHIYARLAPGVAREDVEASLQSWFAGYLRRDIEHPDWPEGISDAEVDAFLSSRLGVVDGGQGHAARARDLTSPVLILSGATALLLLLACLNVANLSLARAVARYRDNAVRAALGASRSRIMTEQLVESALLAFMGGALGMAVTPWVSRWILEYFEVGGSAMALSAGLDGRTLLTALGVATVATIVSGVGPAWYVSSAHPMGALRTRGATGGLGLRRALVVGQVALAAVLLMGAGLFGSTLNTLRATGPGFATDQLVTFAVNPVNDGYSREETKPLLEEVRTAIEAIPGVDAVGYAAWPLLDGPAWGNSMLVEGRTRFITDLNLPMNAVTPDFFDLLGVEVVRGRDFTAFDRTEGEDWSWDKVIVSQSFVERYLEGIEPLGVRIDFSRDPGAVARMEIIGVVEDYAEHQLRDPWPQVYFPILSQARRGGAFYVRTRATYAEVAPQIRESIRSIDPVLTVAALRTVDEQIDRLLVFERMLSALGAAFATFGTLLAMIGIYGVLTFMVQSRTKEVGIRMALGASRVSASRLVVRDALWLTSVGVLVSLPSIWMLGRLIESQLYGVNAMNPLGLLLVTAAIGSVCLVASVAPAWRMASTDPLEALRVE